MIFNQNQFQTSLARFNDMGSLLDLMLWSAHLLMMSYIIYLVL